MPPAPVSTSTDSVAADVSAALPATVGCQGQENAVVQVNRLNVRQGPSQNTEVLDIILREEQYSIIGYSADGLWVQLRLLPSHQTGWVYKPLVAVHCTALPGQRVARHNLAHLWSRGEPGTGVGYVWQDTSLYAKPDQTADVVGVASPDRLLVVQRVIQNAAGERWARLWSPEASGERWIQAEQVIALPTTLAGLSESDTVILGTRTRLQQYEQALQRIPLLPPSDGGHVYDRRTYLPVTVGTTAIECDATCAFLQNWPQRDGAWFLPYEDRWIQDAAAVAVVPLVPLYEVHVSEGWLWDPRQREGYTLENAGPGTWVAMSQKMRYERGIWDPGTWLPANHAGRCRYALDWISVKERWNLAMDEQERQVLADVLSLCDDQHLITTAFALARIPGSGQDESVSQAETTIRVQCDARNEIVTITNPGTRAVNLAGWHLHDANNEHRFTLPRWTLRAGSSVTVVSGGAVGDIHLTVVPIWHNQGDTVYLYDATYHPVAVQTCV